MLFFFCWQQPCPARFLSNRNLNCIALCEGTLEITHTTLASSSKNWPQTFPPTVITSKDLQKHGNIWVCPRPEHVCTRFLFVWVCGDFRRFLFDLRSACDSSQTLLSSVTGMRTARWEMPTSTLRKKRSTKKSCKSLLQSRADVAVFCCFF